MTRSLRSAQLLSVLSFGLAAAIPTQAATQYTLFDIGVFGSSSSPNAVVRATGLNDSGQVVGYQFERLNGGESNPQAFVTSANGVGLGLIGALPAAAGNGLNWSRAYGINNAGTVVGETGNGSGGSVAFSANASGLASLGTLGGSNSGARAINASGQVVGWAEDGTGQRQAFITGSDGAGMRNLNAGSGAVTSATGINASGQVVGAAGASSLRGLADPLRYRNFVTGADGSAPQELVPASGLRDNDRPLVNAINDQGQLVVTGDNEYIGNSLYLQSPGQSLQRIDFSGIAAYSSGQQGGSGQYGPISQIYANTLNELGQIGGSFTNGMQSFAFITGQNGADAVDVNSLSFVGQTAGLGFRFESVAGINNLGQFVVNASNGHAYLISQVPEPNSAALLLAGLGWTVIAARRKRSAGAARASA